MEAALHDGLETPQPLDDVRLGLRNDAHRSHERDNNEHHEGKDDEHRHVANDLIRVHGFFLSVRN